MHLLPLALFCPQQSPCSSGESLLDRQDGAGYQDRVAKDIREAEAEAGQQGEWARHPSLHVCSNANTAEYRSASTAVPKIRHGLPCPSAFISALTAPPITETSVSTSPSSDPPISTVRALPPQLLSIANSVLQSGNGSSFAPSRLAAMNRQQNTSRATVVQPRWPAKTPKPNTHPTPQTSTKKN